MSAGSPDIDCLYPLTLFRCRAGVAMPVYELVEGEQLPEPYRRLLVHTGDMTSRLEAFHGGEIALECLHCEHTPGVYRREVALYVSGAGVPVEYGAIEIRLEAFAGELRDLIVQARLPLGGLLNRFGISYRSQPLAFIRLGGDPILRAYFAAPEAVEFYGRCNVLLGDGDVELARIVEVLRP